MTDPQTVPLRGSAEGLTLKELLQRLFRHWILIASVWAAVLLAVVIWTLVATPKYRSTAVLRIMDDPTEMGLAQQLGDIPGAGLLGLGRDELETEIGILKSWRITEAVVDSLALPVRMRAPKGIRNDWIHVLSVGDPEAEAEITLKRQGEQAYSVLIEEEGEPSRSESPVPLGGSFDFRGYRIQVPESSEEDPPGKIRLKIVPRYEAVDDLRDDLDIRQQEGGSRLVEISLTIPDRKMAAQVVNHVLSEYVAYKTVTERSESDFTLEQLRQEVADYGLRLAQAEELLRTYQEEHLVVAPEEQATQQVRRYAEVLIQQDALEVERSALASLLSLIEGRVEAAQPTVGDSTAYRQLATFPTLISNQAIQDLLKLLMELENERSTLLILRQPENRDVRQLTDRIHELEKQLFSLGKDYLESLDGQMASVAQTLDGISGELEGFPELEMEYTRLYRNRTILNEAYVMLQGQLRLTEIQEAIRDQGVRIVDEGLVAHEDDPEFPKPIVNILLGLILGGVLAGSAGLIRDMWGS